MRETYSTLLQQSKDFAVDSSSSSTTALSDTRTVLARNINSTVQYLFSLVKNYKTQPLAKTFSTVASQIYYHHPPGLLSVESLTITIGTIAYTLKPVQSQEFWNRLQTSQLTGTTPYHFFTRQHDFGIWPTPGDTYTGTLVANYLPQKLSVTDYSEGTVTVSNNSRTITGVLTTFTPAMVGRWFCEADSTGLPIGNWYRISGYTSSTVMTLETVFEESSLSGSSYLIAQSPELPEELHEYIPYRAASIYYSTVRRDPSRAQELLNFFYTGDFSNSNRHGGIKGGVLGILNEYKNKGRANTQIGTMNNSQNPMDWPFRDEAWITTLS